MASLDFCSAFYQEKAEGLSGQDKIILMHLPRLFLENVMM